MCPSQTQTLKVSRFGREGSGLEFYKQEFDRNESRWVWVSKCQTFLRCIFFSFWNWIQDFLKKKSILSQQKITGQPNLFQFRSNFWKGEMTTSSGQTGFCWQLYEKWRSFQQTSDLWCVSACRSEAHSSFLSIRRESEAVILPYTLKRFSEIRSTISVKRRLYRKQNRFETENRV